MGRVGLTIKQKKLIWRTFMGPYSSSLICSKGIADNTDKNIASVVGVSQHLVSNYLNRVTKKRFALIYELRCKEVDNDTFKRELRVFDSNVSNL